MNDARPSKPKLRWYQFRLRTLVVLVALGSLASWYGIGSWRETQQRTERKAQRQNRLREENRVKQQQERRKQQESILAKLESFGPRVEHAGNEVSSLTFSSRNSLTDDDLQHVKGLTGLSYLSLFSQRKVSDAGLEHVKHLANLRTLRLSTPGIYGSETQVTEAGVRGLKNALPELSITPKLEQVRNHTREQLAAIDEISKLNPGQEQAIAEIRILGGLFGRSWIRGRNYRGLRGLSLDGIHVTDHALEHVKELTCLQWLTLNETRVTDAGLVSIEGLIGLQQLRLAGTQVTATRNSSRCIGHRLP